VDLLNIFTGDAFSMISLTDAINKMPFVPGRVGALGIFDSSGITTTTVTIEEQSGIVSILPARLRGEPPTQNKSGKRTMRSLNVPHFPLEDALMASEVQNVRAFGGTELQGVESKRNERLAAMAVKHDVTLEYGRIGAVKGTVLDSDGTTVLFNLFTEFGVSQDTVDFVLGTSSTSMKLKCHAVKRYIESALGASTYRYIHALCGKDWFDKFVTHDEVKEAYYRWQEGSFLRSDQRKGFEFCGIVFEEYVGSVGGVDFVAAGEAHFFPVGVPGLFKTHFAPGDFLEAANTVGLPRYSKSELMDYGRGVKILTESNPISYCTMPKVLVKGTTSN
jgi:hypothetical protein